MSKQMDKIASQTVTAEDLAGAYKTVEDNREARQADKTGATALRFDEGTLFDSRLINGGVVYGD